MVVGGDFGDAAGRRIVVLNWRDLWHPEGGGSELYTTELVNRLAADDHRVTVVTARYRGALRREVRDGVRYLRRGGRLTVYLWAALYLLGARLRPEDRVLEVQNGMPFLARLFTRAAVTVLVHHVHREQWSVVGPALARVGWFLESRAAVRVNRGSRYVAVSEVTRSELVELGVRAADISIAWNGTPPVPAGVEDRWVPARSARPHLVVLGRLVPHKRVEHALDVVAALRAQHPDLQLTIIGSGWWEPQLRQRCAEAHLEGQVSFVGHVSDREKFQVLARSWVHLLPSLKEGWGLSVVEAARMGVPSVAYADAGGTRDSVLDGVTGLLARDLPEMIAQVGALITDHDHRRELGSKARVRAEQFTWEATYLTVCDALGIAPTVPESYPLAG